MFAVHDNCDESIRKSLDLQKLSFRFNKTRCRLESDCCILNVNFTLLQAKPGPILRLSVDKLQVQRLLYGKG